ncbi:Heterokaryon incompatibility protein 6 [Apiospora sp. TS-2023a]
MCSRKPLDTAKSEIRLLKLSSRVSSPLISCHLKVFNLQDKPKYDALSYVWGSTEEDLKEIKLDGAKFAVTKNLHDALTTLRVMHWTQPFWVDALCINQADPQERSHQVGIMDNIYAGASQVVVFLNNARFPGNPEKKTEQLCSVPRR